MDNSENNEHKLHVWLQQFILKNVLKGHSNYALLHLFCQYQTPPPCPVLRSFYRGLLKILHMTSPLLPKGVITLFEWRLVLLSK